MRELFGLTNKSSEIYKKYFFTNDIFLSQKSVPYFSTLIPSSMELRKTVRLAKNEMNVRKLNSKYLFNVFIINVRVNRGPTLTPLTTTLWNLENKTKTEQLVSEKTTTQCFKYSKKQNKLWKQKNWMCGWTIALSDWRAGSKIVPARHKNRVRNFHEHSRNRSNLNRSFNNNCMWLIMRNTATRSTQMKTEKTAWAQNDALRDCSMNYVLGLPTCVNLTCDVGRSTQMICPGLITTVCVPHDSNSYFWWLPSRLTLMFFTGRSSQMIWPNMSGTVPCDCLKNLHAPWPPPCAKLMRMDGRSKQTL